MANQIGSTCEGGKEAKDIKSDKNRINYYDTDIRCDKPIIEQIRSANAGAQKRRDGTPGTKLEKVISLSFPRQKFCGREV